MTAIIRYLFAFMLGMLVGAGAIGYLTFQSDAGNVLVRKTDVVQDLERRLRENEEQRNDLARKLEEVAARAARMEQSFGELERRFRGLTPADERAAPAAPPSTVPAPAVTP